MNGGYGYTVPAAVIDLIASARSRERHELIGIFNTLAHDPFVNGDRVQQDDDGRPLQVKRFRRWEITFWPDHGAREVRIVEVIRLV